MPDFFLIEVSSGVIFLGQREYLLAVLVPDCVLHLLTKNMYSEYDTRFKYQVLQYWYMASAPDERNQKLGKVCIMYTA
jgi:hypothetical protein